MRLLLLKAFLLRKKGHFFSLKSNKEIFESPHLKIHFAPSKLPFSRLGITVLRKQGRATDRNTFKRRVKELYRTTRHLLQRPIDINVFPKVAIKEISKVALKEELLNFFNYANTHYTTQKRK
jgi:ribonuclease P protein component